MARQHLSYLDAFQWLIRKSGMATYVARGSLIVRESERLEVEDIENTQQAVEPDAEGVGGELGGEARGESTEAMRMVSFDVELQGELAVDRLDELTEMRMQLAERLGKLAMLVGDADCCAERSRGCCWRVSGGRWSRPD